MKKKPAKRKPSKKALRYERLLRKIDKVMQPRGVASGRQIARLAKQRHANTLCVVPLYRSALVILRPEGKLKQRGAVEIVLYHDPCWMGEKRTKTNLGKFKEHVVVYGRRSGPDILKDGHELMLAKQWMSHLWWDEMFNKPQAAKKHGKRYTPRCPICHARLEAKGGCPKHGHGEKLT